MAFLTQTFTTKLTKLTTFYLSAADINKNIG